MTVHNPADLIDLEAAVDAIQADIDLLQIDADAIRAVTDAEAILEETGGTLTTDGNVQNLYINNLPAGVFRPICVKVDFTAHTAGETIVLRTYYRITPGGGLIQQDELTYAGLVSPELVNIDLEPNRYGIAVTIEKTVGTNRAYPWAAYYEVG